MHRIGFRVGDQYRIPSVLIGRARPPLFNSLRKPVSAWLTRLLVRLFDANGYLGVNRFVSDWYMDWHVVLPLPFVCFKFSLRRVVLRYVNADCERRE